MFSGKARTASLEPHLTIGLIAGPPAIGAARGMRRNEARILWDAEGQQKEGVEEKDAKE